MPVRQPHARDLAQRRVRLLRGGRRNARADAALLRGSRKRWGLGLRGLRLAALADQLIDGRHDVRLLPSQRDGRRGRKHPGQPARGMVADRAASPASRTGTAGKTGWQPQPREPGPSTVVAAELRASRCSSVLAIGPRRVALVAPRSCCSACSCAATPQAVQRTRLRLRRGAGGPDGRARPRADRGAAAGRGGDGPQPLPRRDRLDAPARRRARRDSRGRSLGSHPSMQRSCTSTQVKGGAADRLRERIRGRRARRARIVRAAGGVGRPGGRAQVPVSRRRRCEGCPLGRRRAALRQSGRIGWLAVFSRRPQTRVGDEGIVRLEELAAGGPALANARRFQEAQRLADLDSLTGLHNRRYFHETLGREVVRASGTVAASRS